MKKKNPTSIAANLSTIQLEKQQPPTIDENCATGSNNACQQTANGDIPQQHAPPLQVRNCLVHIFLSNSRNEIRCGECRRSENTGGCDVKIAQILKL